MSTLHDRLSWFDRWLLRLLAVSTCIALLSWSFSEIIYERRALLHGQAYMHSFDRLENDYDDIHLGSGEHINDGSVLDQIREDIDDSLDEERRDEIRKGTIRSP